MEHSIIPSQIHYSSSDESSPHSPQDNQSSNGYDSNSSKLQAALYLASQGIAVFPVMPQGKAPAAPQVPHGYLDASTREQTIRRWWETDYFDIGAVPGRRFVVVDVDNEHALDVLEAQYGTLPPTLTILTPSGGRHLWYSLPLCCSPIGNVELEIKGVDIRSSNGYVVVPPSEGYVVDDMSDMFSLVSVSSLPLSWLARLLPSGSMNRLASPIEQINSIYLNLSNCPSASPIEQINSIYLNLFNCPSERTVNLFNREKGVREVSWELSEQYIEEAITHTLPTEAGQRHRCLLRLLHRLRWIPDAPTQLPIDTIKQWHKLAVKNGARSSEEVTLMEAERIWDRFNPNKSPLHQAFEKVRGMPPVAGLDAPAGAHALLHLYSELADERGIAFIAQRAFASLINVRHTTVSNWQRRLIAQGFISLEEDFIANVRAKRVKVNTERIRLADSDNC